MNKRIYHFLQNNSIFTLATTENNKPYCAICFYAFDHKKHQLIFKSDNNTRHILEAENNEKVAGSVQNGNNKITEIKGIQFTGKFSVPSEEEKETVKEIYYSRFPLARVVPGIFYTINLEYIKMTDNSLGFGKKILWEKSQTPEPLNY